MHNAKVRNEGVIHVLPEEGGGVKGIKGDSIRPATDTVVLAIATHKCDLLSGFGGSTALTGPVVTFWVLFHRCEERAEDMYRRLWFGWHAGRRI